MRRPLYIIIGILLLFASCGQRQQAKSVVKDFMAEQLHRADVNYLDFSDLDSTHIFSDSLIQVLRQRAPEGIEYQEWKGRNLLYIRVSYLNGTDTCSTTFYLDPDATGIVAFKENA